MMDEFTRALEDKSMAILGASRHGKSGLAQIISRAVIRRGFDGLTGIDPHGEYARAIAEFIANPMNGVIDREVHFIDPSSATTIGINPLDTYGDTSWEACHDAAQLLTSVVEARFGQSAEETPRLAKIVYLAGMLCARKGLTVVELVQLLSIGTDALRDSLLHDFDNTIVKGELEDLFTLAQTQPARFIDYVDSTKSRFVRSLGDPRLMRILGQPHGLNPRKVMDGRAIVLAPLDGLSASGAAFVGTLLTSMYVAAARKRPPMCSARHRLVLDEAESLITVETARLVDQCSKFGLNLIFAIQRLGQIRAKGEFICDALLTNTGIKVCFGGLEPASARFMAETLFTGHIDLAEWKEGTERPTAVGQDRETVRNRSRAESEAVTEGHGEAETSSHAFARGDSHGSNRAHGAGHASGRSAQLTLTPDAGFMAPTPVPGNPVGFVGPTGVLGQSAGATEQDSTFASDGESHVASEVEIDATAHSSSWFNAITRGVTLSAGESECFVTRYEWLPSSTYTLEEQLHRLTGEIMNLPRRICLVKIAGNKPFKTRTKDLSPTFRSVEFRNEMLPVFNAAVTRRSGLMRLNTDIDREIAARASAIIDRARPHLEPQHSDYQAQSQPPPETPAAPPATDEARYAQEFWKRQVDAHKAKKAKANKPKRTKPRLVVDNDPSPSNDQR